MLDIKIIIQLVKLFSWYHNKITIVALIGLCGFIVRWYGVAHLYETTAAETSFDEGLGDPASSISSGSVYLAEVFA